MKVLIAMLLICVGLSYIEAMEKEEMHAIINECKENIGATDDDVAALFKHEALTTTEGKCLRACFMEKGDLMTADSKLNKEVGMKIIKKLANGDENKEKIGEEIVDGCMDIEVPEDHCEAAEAYAMCMRKLAEEKHLTSMELD